LVARGRKLALTEINLADQPYAHKQNGMLHESNVTKKTGFAPHSRPTKQGLTTPANAVLRLPAVNAVLKIIAFRSFPGMPITESLAKLTRLFAITLLVVAVAACSRAPNTLPTGVGNVGAGAATPGSAQEFLVTVGDRVFFETDSSSLTNEAMATLDRQAQWLNQYPNYRIMIEGHADERGTREYNIALGARRGSVVVNYLVSRGVAANRIQTQSFGKERPVAICNDISCWSQNRRAVTVVQ
jgi:peptidoglycan-associated lipoprotein